MPLQISLARMNALLKALEDRLGAAQVKRILATMRSNISAEIVAQEKYCRETCGSCGKLDMSAFAIVKNSNLNIF